MLRHIILFVSIHYRPLLYLRPLLRFFLGFPFISLHFFLFSNSQFCFYLNMRFLPYSLSLSSIHSFVYMCINVSFCFVFGLLFIFTYEVSHPVSSFLACNSIFWGPIHVSINRSSKYFSSVPNSTLGIYHILFTLFPGMTTRLASTLVVNIVCFSMHLYESFSEALIPRSGIAGFQGIFILVSLSTAKYSPKWLYELYSHQLWQHVNISNYLFIIALQSHITFIIWMERH